MGFDLENIRDFLEEKVGQYNSPDYIDPDPISIPHLFSDKEDIEIAGFLTATISWGLRRTILDSAHRLLALMDYAPGDFVRNARDSDLKVFSGFVHRTFNGEDCIYFVMALREIYRSFGGLEGLFSGGYNRVAIPGNNSIRMQEAISHFRNNFFNLHPPERTGKHIADPMKGASAKRINMFLRWMVRKDDRGVDFGIWKTIPRSVLMCPLDVHSGNVARGLGLLKVKQNNWKAVVELTENLRSMDPEDPVKYDFALFGLGIYEGFRNVQKR